MIKKIEAKSFFNELEGGFWMLRADKDYVPVNMPEQLKRSGVMVRCTVEILPDMESIYGTGIVCRVRGFYTLKL